MAKSKPLTLPRTVRVFVNDFGRAGAEPYLALSESPEDAFANAEGEDVIVGIYELKEKVRMRFKVEEVPA